MRSISIRWSASTSDGEREDSDSCPAPGRGEELAHHHQRAFVVLDHELEEQPIELRARRGREAAHFLRRQHARHQRGTRA